MRSRVVTSAPTRTLAGARGAVTTASGPTALSLLGVFCLSVLAVGIVYVVVIRIVDPRGLFGTGRFPVLIQDARREKMPLFKSYAAQGPVEGLLLGSSRSMKLDPKAFTRIAGRRFFNFAVSSARAEDDLAIYRWVRARGEHPRIVVVGLDVEALHNDDQLETPLEFNDELMLALRGREEWRAAVVRAVKRYKRSFGISHLADTVKSVGLVTGLVPRHPATTVDGDGYLNYLDWEYGSLAQCNRTTLQRFAGMTALSPRRKDDIAHLVEEARANGATVKIWLTPLNPETQRYIEERAPYRRLLADTIVFVGDFARRGLADVYDFSVPAAFGGDASRWYDCYHVDESSAAKIAAALMTTR